MSDNGPHRVVVTPPMLADTPQLFTPLAAHRLEVMFNEGGYPLEGDELSACIGNAIAVVLGLDRLTESVLCACPNLRIVARNGVGMDNVDLEAATRDGVLVTAPIGVNSTSVAELTIGLLLTLVRHIIPTHARLQQGIWQRTAGMEVAGKTLGIIGLGRIGKKVAVRAIALEMKVVAKDIAPDTSFAREHGITLLSLDELLSRADIISLHVPLTPLTHHLLNRKTLALLKRGSYLLNTARGQVLDARAVAEALDNGTLAGAALDVHTAEGKADAVLLGRPNVITTTHLGAYTRDSLMRTTKAAVQSIVDILNDVPPSGLMNPHIWSQRPTASILEASRGGGRLH